MREHLEDMLHEAGMDIVFTGHNHAYERTNPIYKNESVACGGAIHITVGDAGGARPEYKSDQGVGDHNKTKYNGLSIPWITPDAPAPPMYDQPEWSIFRSFEWGFGRFTIHNATHADWNFYTSYDWEHTPKDSVSVVHRSECQGHFIV